MTSRSDQGPGQASDRTVRVPLWMAAGFLALFGYEVARNRVERPRAEPGRAMVGAAAPAPARAGGRFAMPRRLYARINDDRIFAVAAGVAFYAILAIFPAIAALVSLYGLYADPQTIAAHLDTLNGVLPGGALDVIGDQLKRVASQRNGTLGLTFAIGLLFSLWSANSGMKGLFDALNVVYREPERRGFIMLNAVSLAFTLGAIGFLLLALAGLVVLPLVFGYLGLGSATAIILDLGRWPVMLAAVGLALAVLYRFGASRGAPRWRWISAGSAFAAVGWLAVSLLFSWYAASFGQYNKTYGSLGAIIGFMTWIWLSAVVLLAGGEVDADRERHDPRPGA